MTDTLNTNQQLNSGQMLISLNGIYRLQMQIDGSLVKYNFDNPVWILNSIEWSGVKPFKLKMQNDGNLVIYDSIGQSIWSTNTAVNTGYPFKLIIQNDGFAILYNTNDTKLWFQ